MSGGNLQETGFRCAYVKIETESNKRSFLKRSTCWMTDKFSRIVFWGIIRHDCVYRGAQKWIPKVEAFKLFGRWLVFAFWQSFCYGRAISHLVMTPILISWFVSNKETHTSRVRVTSNKKRNFWNKLLRLNEHKVGNKRNKNLKRRRDSKKWKHNSETEACFKNRNMIKKWRPREDSNLRRTV